jgi:hypothetical protein
VQAVSGLTNLAGMYLFNTNVPDAGIQRLSILKLSSYSHSDWDQMRTQRRRSSLTERPTRPRSSPPPRALNPFNSIAALPDGAELHTAAAADTYQPSIPPLALPFSSCVGCGYSHACKTSKLHSSSSITIHTSTSSSTSSDTAPSTKSWARVCISLPSQGGLRVLRRSWLGARHSPPPPFAPQPRPRGRHRSSA